MTKKNYDWKLYITHKTLNDLNQRKKSVQTKQTNDQIKIVNN